MLLQALCSISYPLMNSNWNYSPETPNMGQIRWFLEPCDLEIWRMTFKNNRAPLLCYLKLCAAFHSHWWIQTGVTVRKRSFTICIHTNSYDSIAFPLSKYCVEILILQWDHSKLSTYKSPHTSSIWGVTWNRWSHSSIYNKNDANNIFSGRYKIGFEIKNEIEGQG